MTLVSKLVEYAIFCSLTPMSLSLTDTRIRAHAHPHTEEKETERVLEIQLFAQKKKS